jgi:hypothetical protein
MKWYHTIQPQPTLRVWVKLCPGVGEPVIKYSCFTVLLWTGVDI